MRWCGRSQCRIAMANKSRSRCPRLDRSAHFGDVVCGRVHLVVSLRGSLRAELPQAPVSLIEWSRDAA